MGIFDKIKSKFGIKPKDKKIKEEVKKKAAETAETKKLTPKFSTLKPKAEASEPKKEVKAKKAKKEETKEAYKVLVKPLVTEKATDLVSQNQYSFVVAAKANKIEIKKAIKSLYGLEPLTVNIINMRGKFVRTGKTSGKKKNWKKAIITLKAGDKIEIYEGV